MDGKTIGDGISLSKSKQFVAEYDSCSFRRLKCLLTEEVYQCLRTVKVQNLSLS